MNFPAIGIGSSVLGFRPYWCPSPFPSLSILGVFHPLFTAIGFQSCFFFTATHSVDTRCCGPTGGTAVRMEQKTRSKFLPWPGQNLRPWHLAASDVSIRLPRTPFLVASYDMQVATAGQF